MKKQFLALTLASLAAFASPALAKEHTVEANAKQVLGNLLNSNSRFVVVGDISLTTTNSMTVKALATAHVDNVSNSLVVIKVDSNTKIFAEDNKKSTVALNTLKVGQKVLVMGNISGSDLTASTVRLIGREDKVEVDKQGKHKIGGTVTAVTDGSITIKNTLTGVSQTITTNDSTKVNIDGQVKAVSDIKVGDSGWVKFKKSGTTLIAKFFHLFR